MSASTTVYDVVTRYSVETRGANESLRSYSSAATEASRANRVAESSFGGVARASMLFSRTFAPLAVGIGVVGALTRSFKEMEERASSALTVATKLHTVLAFDTDPAKNFASSLAVSEELDRQLVRDATRHPGGIGDFRRGSAAIVEPTLAAGGTTESVREILKDLSVVRVAIDMKADAASRSARSILEGRASASDPLFSALAPTIGIDAKSFRALGPSARLMKMSESLEHLADNPALRGEVFGLFSTQLDNFTDHMNRALSGPEGVGGQLKTEVYDAATEALKRVNSVLEVGVVPTVDALNAGFSLYGEHLKTIGAAMELVLVNIPSAALNSLWNAIPAPLRTLMQYHGGVLVDMAGGLVGDAAGGAGGVFRTSQLAIQAANLSAETGIPFHAAMAKLELRSISEPLLASVRDFERQLEVDSLMSGMKGTNRKNLSLGAPPVINQRVTLQVDLRSDESPEAFAVKVSRALEREAQRPRRDRAAVPLDVAPGARR